MKGTLGLRPVFHHREDRIPGRVQPRWLALLLLRVVEHATGDTWRNIRHFELPEPARYFNFTVPGLT